MKQRPGIIFETSCVDCYRPMWAVDPRDMPVCDQCLMEAEEREKHFEEQQ